MVSLLPTSLTSIDETTMNGSGVVPLARLGVPLARLGASRALHGADSVQCKSFRLHRVAALCAVVAILATNLAANCAAYGQECSTGFRPHDELWFVDSRSASCTASNSSALPNVSVEKRATNANKWQRAKLADLIAADPSVQTVVWVHGNRVSSGESRQRGWEFYHQLTRQADARPVRLIIWSWPADQIRGPLKDVRYKAALSVPAAYHLARYLRQVNPATPMGLVGFSYGSRVITGAMHLQAGGSLGSYRLPKQEGIAGPTPRAVLWASALNDDWLIPGHYHGRALHQLEYATFLNNSCDRALQYYRFLDRCTRPEALGYWGIAGINYLGNNKAKVAQQDVGCIVGSVHTDCSYLYSKNIMSTTWRGLIEPAAPPAAVAKATKPVAPKAAAVKPKPTVTKQATAAKPKTAATKQSTVARPKSVASKQATVAKK
jgi:hypothetical protein